MPRYIDADRIKKALWDSLRGYRHTKEICAVKNCILEIEEAPTADVAEVVYAKWEISSDGYYSYCSHCKTEPENGVMSKYCPECGAKMRISDDKNE